MDTRNTSNGGSLFIEALKDRNIDYIYCCPGTTEVSIIDAVAGRDDIKFILFPFEGPAVAAADGHARVTGQPQVVMLHANVGLANGISQVYSAKMSLSPVVIINVIKPQALLSHGGITSTTDEQEMVKQYTKWDWLSLRPEELLEDIHRAFQIALKPPAGPTLLVIPQDVLEAAPVLDSVYTFPRGNKSYNISPADGEIEKAASILAESRFPLIISGAGVGKENCIDELRELADLISAGICCESRRSLYHNSYPTGERRFLGPYDAVHPATERADVILALGAKLSVEFTSPQKPDIPKNIKLLHQHEDITELDKLYKAEVALCGSSRETIKKLLEALKPLMKDKVETKSDREIIINELRDHWNKEQKNSLDEAAGKKPIKVRTLVESISQFMDSKTTVVIDTPTSDAHLIEYLQRPNAFSCYGHCSGSLGWGTGAALGIKCGAPHQRVICVTGDGSFLFGVQSLWVAYKYRIPVIFIVINNKRDAAVRKGLLRYKGQAVDKNIFPGTDISGIDFVTLANSFSVEADKITEPKAIAPALDKALQKNKPYLLEIIVDPDDF